MTDQQLDAELVAGQRAHLTRRRAAAAEVLRARSVPTEGAFELVQESADAVDEVISFFVSAALARITDRLGVDEARRAAQVAVAAVGGYGRRELCPASDVDLLFLAPDGVEGEGVRALVDLVLYGLWDVGLEIGHAVRTVQECLTMARQDQSVKTGLIDLRPVILPSALAGRAYTQLSATVEHDLLAGSGARELIEQKLEEARRRDERFGNTIFMLEPDVKSGQGGLRELHTARWIARARWKTRTASDLLAKGQIGRRELRTLTRAYAFLLRVRSEIHLLSGRRREVLGFQLQEAIADRLGYTKNRGRRVEARRATERFMRAYYFHARQNRRVSKLIIERATSHPLRGTRRLATTMPAPGGFKTFGGMLTVATRDQFERDPAALIRIFRVAQEESFEIYSFTKDLIFENAGLIDKGVRRRHEVISDFLHILESRLPVGRTLDLMHDLGVLRRLVPEFQRVTAHWQHSLYHVYTVDVHSLFCIKKLKWIQSGTGDESLADLTRRFNELTRPAVVIMAAFLHDVGKGWRKGNHSARGARVARAVGERFEAAGHVGWTATETEDLVWLVEQHLLLSDTSQRRDLSDPELIVAVADEVGTIERLTMLWALTVADMMATSPKVYTMWKASLLRELFDKVRRVLSQARDEVEDEAASSRARREWVSSTLERTLRDGHLTVESGDIRGFLDGVSDRYLLAMTPKKIAAHFEGWREAFGGGEWIRVDHHHREDCSELAVVCPDRPGLLAVLAGTIAANDLQIHAAHLFSLRLPDGRRAALDVLRLQDAAGHLCEDPGRWARVRDDLHRVLRGEVEVESLLAGRRGGSSLPERPSPAVETKIQFSPDGSRTENVLDVFCRDHLGVLFNIATAIAQQGLTITRAKISTQGHRVADGFYVVDAATGDKIEDEARLRVIAEAVRVAVHAAAHAGTAAASSTSAG